MAGSSGWGGAAWSASVHTRLHEFVKSCLLQILVDPYATVSNPPLELDGQRRRIIAGPYEGPSKFHQGYQVCDLYCGCGIDTGKWAQSQIGHYIGIDLSASALSEAREQWECHRRPYPADFCELDSCMTNLESHLLEKGIPTDIVCCVRNLQDCFLSEDQARSLLQNVASLLKPGGYFFGITEDSSTIWSKYQKAVEGAIKAGNLRVNGMLPRVRTDQYVITFEDDRFTPFGMKYQLQFSDGLPSQTQLLVHFPSLIRLAREVGLEYVEIQNTLEFYEDHRVHFANILQNTCGSLLDPKGRLSSRSLDVLSLYTTFIFQKTEHYAIGSVSTPSLVDEDQTQGESSDLVGNPCSEFVGDSVQDTPSVSDPRDQSQMKQSHLLELSAEATMKGSMYQDHTMEIMETDCKIFCTPQGRKIDQRWKTSVGVSNDIVRSGNQDKGASKYNMQHPSLSGVEETNDTERKNQNLPSILGPGPAELRYPQPIDFAQDNKLWATNEREKWKD